jgi:hypothetical protein
MNDTNSETRFADAWQYVSETIKDNKEKYEL